MDYFNEGEREGQLRFAKKRDKFFRPLVDRAIGWGMTPNQMSGVGIVLLLAGAACPTSYFPLMMILVSLYVVTDGLDGCMSRVLNKTTEGGALVDILVDQAGPVIISAAAAMHIQSNPALAVIFSNSYLMFIGLFVYANSIKVTFKRKFARVKYLFYITYALSIIIKFDLMTWFMGLGSIYYIICIIIMTNKIYKFFETKDQ
jgi:phosphatidylglycerophosphate synthase